MDDEVGRLQIGRDRVRHVMLAQLDLFRLRAFQPGRHATHIVVQHRQADLLAGRSRLVPVAHRQHQVVAQEACTPRQPHMVASQRLELRTGLADQRQS